MNIEWLILEIMNTTELVVEIRPEKILVHMVFEPMTSAILMQCSTNWANKPTGSGSLCWIQTNLQRGE